MEYTRGISVLVSSLLQAKFHGSILRELRTIKKE